MNQLSRSEQERLQQAQAALNEIALKYGVAIVPSTVSVSVSDGSTIVRPQVTLQIIHEWKGNS